MRMWSRSHLFRIMTSRLSSHQPLHNKYHLLILVINILGTSWIWNPIYSSYHPANWITINIQATSANSNPLKSDTPDHRAADAIALLSFWRASSMAWHRANDLKENQEYSNWERFRWKKSRHFQTWSLISWSNPPRKNTQFFWDNVTNITCIWSGASAKVTFQLSQGTF